MDEADPEFLALPERQKRTIDRAFNRGLRILGKRPAKRRRLNNRASASGSASRSVSVSAEGGGFIDEDAGGGFIPDDDAGGFIPDDSGGGFIDDGGGFIPEDSGGGFIDDDSGGGFIPEDDGGGFMVDDTPAVSRASTPANAADRIPLRLVPSLLSTLGLPTDEDVLAVFRASAEGWGDEEEDGKGKGKEREREKEEESVSRKDFRAVCAALMDVDEGGDGGDGGVEEDEVSSEDYDDDDDDAFRPSDDDEEFAEDDDNDGDYGASTSKKAPKTGRGRGRGRRARDAELEEAPAPKLSGQQRELARELWEMLKPNATGVGAHVLGVMELKRWVREMGEMWSEDEIADMITLFSSQHEGRGLTFEDFGVVMLRAGLV